MPKILTAEKRQQLNESLLRVDSAPSTVSDEVLDLANQLSAIHGRIHVANEKSGLHLYMASPACLESDGAGELDKRHLAVNVLKYLDGENMAASCMKTGTPYNVLDLLSMQPLDKRGYELKAEVVQHAGVNPEYLEPDANGNMIPKSPGLVVPAYTLSPFHPARLYLRDRGFCPYALWQQFRLSWCTQERDDIFYRRLLGSFRATSQNRLIFYIDINGINRGWQARILEMVEHGFKYYFHPYTHKWVKVEQRNPHYNPKDPKSKSWIASDERWEGWDPVKYLMGHGGRRNEVVMGFDAAVKWHDHNTSPNDLRWCVLAEGPLDAGRAGPPAMAILGKSFSPEQCALICSAFDYVIYIQDKDAAGEKAAAKVLHQFAACNRAESVVITTTPGDYKDLGEMPDMETKQFIQSLRR